MTAFIPSYILWCLLGLFPVLIIVLTHPSLRSGISESAMITTINAISVLTSLLVFGYFALKTETPKLRYLYIGVGLAVGFAAGRVGQRILVRQFVRAKTPVANPQTVMQGYIEQTQPFCDEPLQAAWIYQAGGIADSAYTRVFGPIEVLFSQRKARKKAGKLSHWVVLAVSEQHLYVFTCKAGFTTFAPKIDQLHSKLSLNDIEAIAGEEGLFHQLEIKNRISGESLLFESTGSSGEEMRSAFNAMVEIINRGGG